MKIFITGGAKNGKSGLAQELAVQLAGDGPHYYVATMIPSDGEDRCRIQKHIADRAGMGFITLEQGRQIENCLRRADPSGTFLLDSVTALFLNELFPDPAACTMDQFALERCKRGLRYFAEHIENGVFVSDYIYSDAIGYDEVTETYRRGLAELDKMLCSLCDRVIEMSAGCAVYHKGAAPE